MTAKPERRILTGPNPFDADPALDLLHAKRADIEHWSETMYFHVWDPVQNVGVFIHTGRWPADLDLWWAQVIALLPDGELLVDRSWGRSDGDRGPATGNLQVECLEPHKRWRLRFDGAGEITTVAAMAGGPVGGGPARPFQFDIEIDAAAPVWDMHAAVGIRDLSWAGVHHVQGFRAAGSLGTQGAQWNLQGVAHRDHSSGPRHFSDFGGLHFFTLVFPDCGRVLNGLVNWKRDGSVDHRVYTEQEDGRCEVGTQVSVTGLQAFETLEPRDITIILGREDGQQDEYAARGLHGYVLTLLEPNENINGAAHEAEDDPLLVSQTTVEVTAPDGQLGYGVVERDYRRSFLPSPQAR